MKKQIEFIKISNKVLVHDQDIVFIVHKYISAQELQSFRTQTSVQCLLC